MWHDLQQVLAQMGLLWYYGPCGMEWYSDRVLLLRVIVNNPKRDPRFYGETVIRCTSAIDWHLRPLSPGWLAGGPPIQLEDGPQLEKLREMGYTYVNTSVIPGSDGDCFDPPLQLRLLLLDYSFVLAEQFEIAEVGTATPDRSIKTTVSGEIHFPDKS